MPASPAQPKSTDPADKIDDLGEESDDYDAEFDEEEDVFDEEEDDEEEEDDDDEDGEPSGEGLTALLLGSGEEVDEEEEDEFEAVGPAEAQTAAQPATPATGTKRALDETEDEVRDTDKNGGRKDSGPKKAKVS